ncbi:MAG: hypothetical protein EP343_25780 [Deltaproteobacteria bacterium]|nr:MAG: hypothetical protein EP343_25780 [Deltaproteobacteria bacterium]
MRWSVCLFVLGWMMLGLSFETQASGAGVFKPGSTAASLGVSQQAHLFDDPSSANSVLLFGIVPLVGVGDVALLSGNLYALIANRRRTLWGWAGVLMSGVSLALVPFFAAEGVGWAMVPLIPSVLLLGLSITNIVLGMLYPRTCIPPIPKKSTKRSFFVAPWFGQGKDRSLQGGVAVSGRF